MEKEHILPKRDPSLPLWDFYIDRNTDFIGRILLNYFSAIERTFPVEWKEQPKKFILRKTAGYLALLMVLRRAWPNFEQSKDVSPEAFLKLAATMKEKVGDMELTSAKFPSSEQGAKQLADFLYPA